MRRWGDWSWEEPGAEEPDAPRASAAPTVSRIRPRPGRIGAVAVAAVLVALLLTATGSHGGDHHGSAAHPAAGRHAHRAHLPPAYARPLSRQAEERAIDSVLAHTPAVVHGGARGNEVALTFDDGPGPYTQRLVDVLNGLHVHATFFAIGEEERWFSAGTQLELGSGDVVGDHTETHPMMALLSRREQHEQLFDQMLRIELLGGPRPRLFRPPYGSFDATTLRQLRALHLLMILWSTDTADYTRPGVGAIVHSALAGAHPGAIILMHDAGGDRSQTIAALPAIVRGLRRRGLHPVTVPRLLLDDPPARGEPLPRSLAGD